MQRAITWLPLLLLGCTAEPRPPQNPTCWSNWEDVPLGDPEVCDDELCVEKETEVVIDSQQSSEAYFGCIACTGMPPEYVSTDDHPQLAEVEVVGAEGLSVRLRFDNRATQEPTLENLKKYALTAYVSYQPPQGGSTGASDVPFEVVSYEGGRLRVRLSTEFHGLQKWENSAPGSFCSPNLGISCDVDCRYIDSTSGGAGAPMQFSADITAPLILKPYGS